MKQIEQLWSNYKVPVPNLEPGGVELGTHQHCKRDEGKPTHLSRYVFLNASSCTQKNTKIDFNKFVNSDYWSTYMYGIIKVKMLNT